MNAIEFAEKVRNKEIDVVEHTEKILDKIEKINKEFHYFNTISRELAVEQAKKLKKSPKGKLAGIPVSVKDCICVKDVETTAGSKILTGYKPVYNATAVEKAIKEGAIIIGKTSQDEFGFGGFNTNVGIGFEMPRNPFDKLRCTGGSSGGAAGITQLADFPHIAIAESTGGSIACPASFCGVAGMTPTYGLVSRYGLIDYASSMDKIGVMAKSAGECRLMLNVIKGRDAKDSTSIEGKAKIKTIRSVAVIKEAIDVDDDVKNTVLKCLEKNEIEYDIISLPLVAKYSNPAYYILAASEASTNLARYSGFKYGAEFTLDEDYNHYFSSARSACFGKEAKRRILMGTFARMAGFRDAFYLKAAKVRTMIINEYKEAFKHYDLIAGPTMPCIAPKLAEISKLTPLQQYMMDKLTVGPNLAGLPHINVTAGFSKGLPIGMMLTGGHFCEDALLSFAEVIRQA
ncbi:MAG: aspartyl/glutamyl-tRNA amidotransferase subunit A [Nanoarchaeota archaeon]|nr:aspartyl/glutamyl-tRNA amidotransferase subunit A [Nanoarchaeota archaeon]